MRSNNLNETKKSYYIQSYLDKKKSKNIFTPLNVLITFLLVTTYNLHAQNSAFVVTEINSYLNSSNSLSAKSTQLNKVDIINKENIQNLTTKVQPTINFYNGACSVPDPDSEVFWIRIQGLEKRFINQNKIILFLKH